MPSSEDERFDCLKHKQQEQSRLYKDTRDLDALALITYFRRGAEAGPFSEWWANVQADEVHRVAPHDDQP